MGAGFRRTIPTDPGEVARVNAAFTEFAEAHAVPPSIRRSMNVALDELLHNTIVHGFAGRQVGTVTVEAELRADRLTVTVTDDGGPFNPLDAAAPDIRRPVEERPIGGLGLHLVRQLMDDVRYRRHAGRNIVVLVKRLTGGGAGGGPAV